MSETLYCVLRECPNCEDGCAGCGGHAEVIVEYPSKERAKTVAHEHDCEWWSEDKPLTEAEV